MTDIDLITQSQNREQLDKKPFSVMARVALQLGRESISNSITAITELVKNSYDADAEKVKITFSGLDLNKKSSSNAAYIVIEDDGNGMSYTELIEKWLVIGTPNKLMTVVSEAKNRVLTGEKGLGRLGLDRLSAKTILRTFSESMPKGTEVIVDWEKYEKIDETLDSIKHDLFSIPKKVIDPSSGKEKKIKKGTQLILYGLKDLWNIDYLRQLKNELTLLVSPFAGMNDFAIYLDSRMKISGIDGKIGSEYMLQAADWVVEATIHDDGRLSYSMLSNPSSVKYELQPISWKERFKDAATEMPRCGPLKFEMYFFPM